MDNVLKRLQEWYANQCNGDWEHQYLVKIESLDNPGWIVKIDLMETKWQDAAFPEFRVKKNDSDWINCFKRETQFVGSCDPSKLTEVLAYFLKMVDG